MRLLQVAAVFSLILFAGADAQARCPSWRPCGAGDTWYGNRLVPQGFYGADFRPACAAHDECLASGACRADCDRQFLSNMCAACQSSSNPRACERKARMYYRMTRLFGGLAR